MKLNVRLICLISIILATLSSYGQNSGERSIYIMRPKNFLGSGNKMDIQLNGKSIYKLKSGRRLIIKTNLNDTLNFQVIYPLMPKYKSNIIRISPSDNKEIFLEAFYSGMGKGFQVDFFLLDDCTGKENFFQLTNFKDNNNEIEILNLP